MAGLVFQDEIIIVRRRTLPVDQAAAAPEPQPHVAVGVAQDQDAGRSWYASLPSVYQYDATPGGPYPYLAYVAQDAGRPWYALTTTEILSCISMIVSIVLILAVFLMCLSAVSSRHYEAAFSEGYLFGYGDGYADCNRGTCTDGKGCDLKWPFQAIYDQGWCDGYAGCKNCTEDIGCDVGMFTVPARNIHTGPLSLLAWSEKTRYQISTTQLHCEELPCSITQTFASVDTAAEAHLYAKEAIATYTFFKIYYKGSLANAVKDLATLSY